MASKHREICLVIHHYGRRTKSTMAVLLLLLWLMMIMHLMMSEDDLVSKIRSLRYADGERRSCVAARPASEVG